MCLPRMPSLPTAAHMNQLKLAELTLNESLCYVHPVLHARVIFNISKSYSLIICVMSIYWRPTFVIHYSKQGSYNRK